MYSGLYAAATGMLVQQLRQEIISQNLANVSSPGYKQRQTTNRTFSEVMLHTMKNNRDVPIGTTSRGVQLDSVVVDWSQGTLDETKISTDVALDGRGFLSIEGPEGTRYTRNGSFQVDPEGFMISTPDHYLLGEHGRIKVGQGEFQLTEDGNVWQDGQVLDKLLLADFEPEQLTPVADGLFEASGNGKPAAARTLQGFVEKSNLDPIKQIMGLTEIARIYETNQRVVQIYDQIMSKGANELGLLR